MPRQHPYHRMKACYCDLHVHPPERIPYELYLQHSERLETQAEESRMDDSDAQLTTNTLVDNGPEVIEIDSSVGVPDELEETMEIDPPVSVPDELEHEHELASTDDEDLYKITWGSGNRSPPYWSDSFEDSDEDDFSEFENDMQDICHRFSSFESLENVADWEIEDERLCDALRWEQWRLDYGYSYNVVANRPLDRSEPAEAVMSHHKLKSELKSLSGLASQTVACCTNNCAAFVENGVQLCEHCSEPIYSEVGIDSRITRPRKEFFYFSPVDRLLLEYANPTTAQAMNDYMDCIWTSARVPQDFWHGSHFAELKPLFDDRRTIALSLSIGGLQKVQKKGFSAWPILLTVLNYPPRLRAQNTMVVGLIPGPKEPLDMYSFLAPLLADLVRLATDGVPAYDGDQKEHFLLKAHLTVVSIDFPRISKLMVMPGVDEVSPCQFCTIKGQHSERPGKYYFPRRESAREYRSDYLGVAMHEGQHLETLQNIRTLNFPNSFGLDIMHVLSTVAKTFWDLWCGKLLAAPTSNESYVLSKDEQAEIGLEMSEASRTIPLSVSRKPRNICKSKSSLNALDWIEWITIYSSPLLYGRLPEHDFLIWQFFVIPVKQLVLQPVLNTSTIPSLEKGFETFVDLAEKRYYQGITANLPLFTLELHSLLHIGTTIKAMGSTNVNKRFGMKLFAKKLKSLPISKNQVTTSLYAGLTESEQLRYIQALYKLGPSKLIEDPPLSEEVLNASSNVIGMFTGKRVAQQMVKDDDLYDLLCQYYCLHSPATIALDYRVWTKFVRKDFTGIKEDFVITAKPLSHPTRDHGSSCKYKDQGGAYPSFGSVRTFIEHQHNGITHHLAMITQFQTLEDTQVGSSYYFEDLAPVVVGAYAISDPVGAIRRVHHISEQWRKKTRTRTETRFWIVQRLAAHDEEP